MSDQTINIGFLLFPKLTQLDLTGPVQVLSRMPGAKVHLIWKTLDPVPSDTPISILPTMKMSECPQLDVICVPGGSGQIALMDDAETLDFLRQQAAGAKYVTSVCTGSLVLGAAGLLEGYRAACHWMSRDQLTLLGATPTGERVVKDRNRISGGGVTAGIDFGLTVVAELCGPEAAKAIQLSIEYAPHPPFNAGSPEGAGPELVARVTQMATQRQTTRLAATKKAAAALA